MNMLHFFGMALILAAWITHVMVCFKPGMRGFLIAVATYIPVALANVWSWF